MFKKLVAIEPVNLTQEGKSQLVKVAEAVKLYDDLPASDAEIVKRIGDADGVLVSYTSAISGEVLRQCPNLKYVGMCCSLYAPENANVDIVAADSLGITVKGVRDYGDEGVREYVVSELVNFLHGFRGPRWRDQPAELTGLNIGVLGMGTTGQIVAKALSHFDANIHYYSRTRKPELEEREGFTYMPLHQLLEKVDILCACLTKNVILLGEKEFEIFGSGKIFMNTSIGPAHEASALSRWLEDSRNSAFSDTPAGLGGNDLLELPNVFCVNQSAGTTSLAKERLSRKVLENIQDFFTNQ